MDFKNELLDNLEPDNLEPDKSFEKKELWWLKLVSFFAFLGGIMLFIYLRYFSGIIEYYEIDIFLKYTTFVDAMWSIMIFIAFEMFALSFYSLMLLVLSLLFFPWAKKSLAFFKGFNRQSLIEFSAVIIFLWGALFLSQVFLSIMFFVIVWLIEKPIYYFRGLDHKVNIYCLDYGLNIGFFILLLVLIIRWNFLLKENL